MNLFHRQAWRIIALVTAMNLSFSTPSGAANSVQINPNLTGVGSGSPQSSKYQISASFMPSASTGGVSGQLNQLYLYNQSCSSGWAKYSLSTGTPYLIVPVTGTYVVSYYIEAYNNNGGSVEWNNLQFNLNYMAPGQTNYLVTGGTITPSMSGGGCNSCSQYSIPYYWWVTAPATKFTAGTQIWISGEVTGSGTNCSGNSVLILAGGIGMTQQ